MERVTGVLLPLLMFCAVFLTVRALLPHPPRPGVPKPVVLAVPPRAATGADRDALGEAASPFTLIEFADYECPPCAQVARMLPPLLAEHRGRLRLVFRNYPLAAAHPHALAAAEAAEAARLQGRFWAMHDALYNSDPPLTPGRITALARNLALDLRRFDRDRRGRAARLVAADRAAAAALGISGTPTFVLCCPGGRVIRLGTLEQAEGYLR